MNSANTAFLSASTALPHAIPDLPSTIGDHPARYNFATVRQSPDAAPHTPHTSRFTGKFACGSRRWCEESIEKRGGIAINNITKKLDYLVIGEIGSRDWIHSTHGRKIEKAIEYNENDVPIYIISEQYWYEKINA